MAYAGAKFTMSLVRAFLGEEGINECSFVEVPNMEVQYFGVLVDLGKEGIEKIHPIPKLNSYEQSQWKELIPILKANIEKGIKFIKG